MFGLEFGGSSFELKPHAESLEGSFEEINQRFLRQIEQAGSDLETINYNLLRQIEQGSELINLNFQRNSLLENITTLQARAVIQENMELYNQLEKLRSKTSKVSSISELEHLKKQLKQIKSSQTSMQIAKTAQAEIAVKRQAATTITDVCEGATDIMTDGVKPSVQTSKLPVTKVTMDKAAIKAEAAARTQAQNQAALKAEQAQRFYSSLSDAATGKSAEESAKVIKEAAVKAEAAARTQAQNQAALKAEQAQRFYSGLSDATTGKSAEESAKIIEEAAIKAEAAARTQAQNQAASKAEQAQKICSSLSDAATGKSTEESTKVIEEAAKKTEAAIKPGTTANFKDKILKIIKSKKFKYSAIIAAAITIGALLFVHFKKKNEKNNNLNVVK